MVSCPYTRLGCTHPHLKCSACPVPEEAHAADKDLLVRARQLELPDVYPYAKIVRIDDKPGLEIGIKGTF